MTFSSSVSPRILGSRGTTDADQPPHPAVRLRKGLINSGTAYRKTKATLYSLQDAEEFYVLSNYINKSKASKRYWLAFLSAPYTKEDEKVYNSGWSVEIAIPKKAQPEAGEHGEGTLPAPWEEIEPIIHRLGDDPSAGRPPPNGHPQFLAAKKTTVDEAASEA
ncbi:uncharacterized protein LW94_1271 [Fusarium fujikuroi]|nr:uncharacterized protein LW94_1271 [Fusarium fujikuroi]